MRLSAAKPRFRVLATFAVLLAAPAPLASCASSGGGSSSALKTFWKGGSDNRPDDITADYFTQSVYCPRVEVRAGTESMAFYEKGHDGDASFVKYQASLGKTARECRNTGADYTLKIGIAGRVVAGPKGGPGTVTVPVRVAIAQQLGGVAYSELFKIPVDLAAPNFANDFAHVVEQVALQIPPDQQNYIIYVGFDDGKAAKPTPKNVPTG